MHTLTRLFSICIISVIIAGTWDARAFGQRRTEKGMGYFAVGSAMLDLDDLNAKMADAGYNKLPNSFNLIGGGGFAVHPSGLIIGGEGYGAMGRSVTTGAFTTKMDGGMGFFDIGYVVFSNRAVSVYPILGIGGGGFTLHISETNVSNFNGILADPRRESNVSNGAFMLNLSVGGDVFIPMGERADRQGGLVLGVRVGYFYSPWSSDWNFAGSTLSNSPSSVASGPYVNFVIGGGSRRPR